eukprot:c850_g1_i1 orf=312-659(+)
MAAGGAFGGARGLQPIPPEKGVFPLDRDRLCQPEMQVYLSCLQDNSHEADKCRQLSKNYLECRMERNLMSKQDLSTLGFKEEDHILVNDGSYKASQEKILKKEQIGFVSGLPKGK